MLTDLQRERLSNVHFHTFINKVDHVPFTKNNLIDLNYLRSVGYTGNVVVEVATDYFSGQAFETKMFQYLNILNLLEDFK